MAVYAVIQTYEGETIDTSQHLCLMIQKFNQLSTKNAVYLKKMAAQKRQLQIARSD